MLHMHGVAKSIAKTFQKYASLLLRMSSRQKMPLTIHSSTIMYILHKEGA